MYRQWMVVALVAGQAACDEAAPDGSGMVIETVAEQPDSAALGVSLAIHARGGRSVFVAVERGAFLIPTTPGQPPAPQQSACVSDSSADLTRPFTIAMSIRPTDQEALMFASLFVDRDCSGELVQSRIVAVHPLVAVPVPVDASMNVAREVEP